MTGQRIFSDRPFLRSQRGLAVSPKTVYTKVGVVPFAAFHSSVVTVFLVTC